jgi:hypothetical protein
MDSAGRAWDAPAMEGRTGYLLVLLVALGGILALLRLGRSGGLFTGGRGRLPRAFAVAPAGEADIPPEAALPIRYLGEKLATLGFVPAGAPVRVPVLDRRAYRLLLAPFAHLEERAFFVMGIESGLGSGVQLMLHLVTPLAGGRRVETTTLAPLESVARPPRVEAQVVLDAGSVEEVWSRHRRALSRHPRADRVAVEASDWEAQVAACYEAWLQTGVRAQRLMLESNGVMYRVRARPRSVV